MNQTAKTIENVKLNQGIRKLITDGMIATAAGEMDISCLGEEDFIALRWELDVGPIMDAIGTAITETIEIMQHAAALEEQDLRLSQGT